MHTGRKSPTRSAGASSSACVHIVEANGSGHRLYYVRLLAEHALNRNYRVVLQLRDTSLASPEFRTHIEHLSEHVAIVPATSFTLDEIAQRAGTLDATVTVIPDGDGYVYAVARGQRWKGSGRLSLLAMRERSEPRRTRLQTGVASALKRAAFWLARRAPRVTVHVLASAAMRSKSASRVADPVTFAVSHAEAAALRQEWSIDPTIFVFAIVGAIDDRKNVPLVLGALADAATQAGDQPAVLLLAGRLAPNVREAIANCADLLPEGVDLVIVDEVLDDRRFDGAVALADCIVLAHSNDGPSGVLGKAAAAGTRVLAAGSATLRRDCEAIGNGAHWTELDRLALAEGFAEIRRRARPEPRSMPTADQFAATLMGLP